MSDRKHKTADALLEHAQWAHALARRLVGDAASADDVVQEAYATALRCPPADPEGVRPWFGRVLTNVVRMQRRAMVRREARERRVHAEPTTPTPSELAERAEGQRVLVEAVLALDEPYRSTVLLRYFEDLSAAEIARRQELPAATVRWRLQEGLARLRAELNERFAGDTKSWCTLLLPLATVPAPGVLLAPVTPSLLSAVVVMNILKSAVVIGGLCVAAFFLVVAGVLPGFGGGAEESELPPVEVTFGPLEDKLEDIPVASGETLRTRVRPDNPTAQHRQVFATARARFVDAQGQPITGVTMSPQAWQGPKSGADGIVTVELEDDVSYREWGHVSLDIRHLWYANQKCSATLREGEVTDLGSIPLRSGGSIRGRVIDLEGQPAGNVQVFVEAIPRVESMGDMRSTSAGNVGRSSTRTNEHGEFLLRGVPAGFRVVEAREGRYLHVKSGKVEVRPREESLGVELVLSDPVPASRQLTGVVVDPDGNPVPGASLKYRYSAFLGFQSGSGGRSADREGRFRINVEHSSVKFSVVACDYDNADLGPGMLDGVKPGKDHTIRLTHAEHFEIRVVDERGVQLRHLGVHVNPVKNGVGSGQHFSDENLTDGVVKARVPPSAFEITSAARGHESKTFGPFEPDYARRHQTIRCVLASAPVLSGTVTADGEPVANAVIHLHPRCHEHTVHNGFPVWLSPHAFASTQTDSDGKWSVTVRKDVAFFVRVAAKGYASFESRELPPVRGRSPEPLSVELDHGGTLHGRVFGGDVAGKIVGISRGDAAARTMRADSSGQFCFANVTPGRYMVKLVGREIRDGASSTQNRWGRPYRETEWVCEVSSGRATRHDLGVLATTPCGLRGNLRLHGVDVTSWQASLSPIDTSMDDVPLDQLDASGAFELTVAAPGRYRLIVQNQDDGLRPTLIAELVPAQ